MTYVTRDREAGNVIDEFDTFKEAEEAIRKYEEEDKTDGTYTPNFYEIAEDESEDMKMEKKMTWKKTCPICGSRHTDRFEDAYWGMCRECGFNSMASESLEQATEAWNKGYLDIEDKAKHEGIDGFTHDELADLWWYEVGMDGCSDMGMQPEEVDEFWDTHPDDLKEEVHMMWSRIRQFV